MAGEQSILYPEIDTPAVLLDLDRLEANIKEMSHLAAEAGLRLRPHVKVHESADIAKLQMDAGACGIEVGPVDQALAMAEAGFNDIIIAHPFYGTPKLEKLKKLIQKPGMKVAVVFDMFEQAEGISQVGQALDKKVPVIIKLETGANRYGVQPGKAAVEMAKRIRPLPGVQLKGIYTHEAGGATLEEIDKMAFDVAVAAEETAKLLKKEGFTIDHVSAGASNTYQATCRYVKKGKFTELTEIHPGSCVIGSMMHVHRLAMTLDQCAMTVLVSVMSTSHHPTLAVVDAGIKTFGGDSLIWRRDAPDFFWEDKPGFGYVKGRPDLWVGFLHAETGRIFYKDQSQKLALGERVEIIPNNSFVVINLHKELYGVRKDKIEKMIPVTGMGRGT